MNSIFEDYHNALTRLEEILSIFKTDITRDSAIKRFELCFDLAWKLMKHRARYEGIECNSPRACIKAGFQIGMIDEDVAWLDMIEDRNKSVHVYDEQLAEEVYHTLSDHLIQFQKLFQKIKNT
ncbi:MAG: nucleotidyltransferase substrate binding protein [Candidatus Magasanikbacteria bacterium]|nr:nucleotidyltransferase substrate binding protein [Candidatus Magasanikbacteria bacterium]